MKCQICGAEIDDEIEIDEWYDCPICHSPMLGFKDNMLDMAVTDLLTDVRIIEKRLLFLSRRLHGMTNK